MDFEQNNNQPQPVQAQPSAPIYNSAVEKPPKKHRGRKIFWGILIALSVLANIVLLMMLIFVSMAAAFGVGYRGILVEQVIQEGPRSTKIAVITVQGVIDDEKARHVSDQLKSAWKDEQVKGLIIRIDSPGGTVSASDRIYNQIKKYQEQTKKPAIAFMQGLAASGGYYTAVACEKIIAEPTTITGSIGVIWNYFVLQELLEEKLGILPVVIKSGEKKDWPSLFHPPTEEQRQYLQDKVNIAYERFVQVVADGRPSLQLDDVKRLADGSIYVAQEARDANLIDQIGYLDEAIEMVKSLAKIEKAQVVEYHKPFSLIEFLSSRSQNVLKISRTTLYELSTPEILYLWNGYE
jgi:protease-4